MKKVYLKDLKPEQVLERLQKGEIIYHEIFPSISYKFINNILCKITFDGIVYNDGILVNDNNRYLYFKEEEPLKIEVGKYYKTVGGDKVFCYYINDTDFFQYKMVTMNKQDIFSVNDKGNRFVDIPSISDIVDYWKD